MANQKKWPYIVGSIVLIGASYLLRRKAMKLLRRSKESISTAPEELVM